MSSVESLLWLVCGLTLLFPHAQAASLSPSILRMISSAPVTNEESVNEERRTETTDQALVNPGLFISTSPEQQIGYSDPPSNYTASTSSSFIMTTSYSTSNKRLDHPEQQTDSAGPSSMYTASPNPNLLTASSDPINDELMINSEQQTESGDVPSKATMGSNLLMTASDSILDDQSFIPEHQTESGYLFSTGSLSSNQLTASSYPISDEQSDNPQYQTEPGNVPSQDGGMHAWIDGLMGGCMGGYMNGWVDGWIDGLVDGCMDGEMHAWIDGLIGTTKLLLTTSDPISGEQSSHQTESGDLLTTASVSPNQIMTASDPFLDDQLFIPEHQTESGDPPSTTSVSPDQITVPSDPYHEDTPINPEHQTETASPSSTATLNPSSLTTSSNLPTSEKSITPEPQAEPGDPPSAASPSPSLLMTTSDVTEPTQSITPESTGLFNSEDTASVNSIFLKTTYSPSTEAEPTTPKLKSSTEPPKNNTGLVCLSVLPPRRGSYYVEHGTGVSVGSMLVFWCKEGYQLVGHEKITCILHAGIPRRNNQGLRVALLVSGVSGGVILVMTVCFIVCCCQECMSRKKEKHRIGRSRRRETRSSRSRRSPSWLEREHIDWEAFPPPKLFSLSQRLDRPLPPGSPVYTDIIRSYENRGYERSQESLLRSTNSSYPSYHTNSQMYPALVFQRVQTEPNPSTSSSNPVYVQISTPPKNKTTHASRAVTNP
ncbi:hypothetical protein DNTS_032320 [Danionella cerebrum]|uniref:Sushi domain-containing protein n=1 Tax=Danionella cerebrum TaxID=2873325 RepID=A0A553QID4_9TELE|nr:hypothetical protein DNTS_032320 [Danionella translucida]